jgi:Glyoxalase/Bleomycin resistance protein/Dioxygenase superfamily
VDETPREGLAGSICFLHPRAHAGVLVELVDAPDGSDAASVPAQPPDTGPPPGIRLAGVGIIATDLDLAVAAWRDVSGLSASRIIYDEREGAMAACLQLRDVEIDIKHPTHESSPLARELSVRGEGLLSLRLAAADLDKVIALLEVRGVQVGEPLGRIVGPRVALIDETDSLGTPLEIGEATA